MMLAKWFSGKQLDVSDDEVFQELMLGKEFPELQVISWKDDHDFIEAQTGSCQNVRTK